MLGQVIFEYIYIPFIFYYCLQLLVTLRVSSLLLSLIDAFVDIVADQGCFKFSPESEFTSHLYVQMNLEVDTEAESPCFSWLLQC